MIQRALIPSLALLLLCSPARALGPAVVEGLQLLDDWQLEDALQLSQQLLREHPDDPEVWMLAGRVQHQRGEHESAVALLNAARAAGVQTGYVHALAQGSAAYGAHFQTLTTEHFSIRYLNKDEIVAHYAAPVLEAAYTRIGAALEILPAERGEKIVVEIYPDARGLASATGLTVQEIATSGTIAVCKFHRLMITSPLATADGYSWADTVAHELVHLMISKKSHNNIPIWLHEGIAKFYESVWNDEPGMALEPFSEKLLADATKKQEFITYEQMHPSMAKLPSQEDAALAFAEVFTTIEFLTKRYGSKSIPKVLELTGQGVSLEVALNRVFKMSLAEIESAWRRYLSQREFRIVPGAAPEKITLATSEKQAKEEKPLETMDDRQVHDYSRLGELLQLRGHNQAAVVEYEKAYARAGVKYATLVYRLARAYIETDRGDEALEVLNKNLTVHPNDNDSRLLAGRLLLEKKRHAEAKAHFEAVRLKNPFNPEIHYALREVYQREGKAREAALEERFFELSRKPRPTRVYELPAPPAGNARVSVIPPRWDHIRISGSAPLAAPLWDYPVNAGTHTIEYRDAKGAMRTHEFTVGVGETQRLVLK